MNPRVLKGPRVLWVLTVLGAACGQREAAPPGNAKPAASARPTDAKQEDWTLYSSKKNAQDELIVAKDSIAAAHTDWPLVDAQLKELRRSGGTLSVKLDLYNGGVEMQKPMFMYKDVHIVDPNTGAKYDVVKDNDIYLATTNKTEPDRFYEDAEPGETIVARITFAAPPPQVKIVDLEIPNIRTLEGLLIQDARG